MKVAVPRFWVQSLVWIIIELNIKNVFTGRIIEGRPHSWSTLLLYVESSICCFADLIILTLLGHIFEVNAANGIGKLDNRFVLDHFVTLSLDKNIIILVVFT